MCQLISFVGKLFIDYSQLYVFGVRMLRWVVIHRHVATLRLLGGLCVKTAFIHRVSYLHLQLAPCSDAACGSGWKRQYFNGFHLFICISHMSAQQPFVPFPPQPRVLEVRCRVEVHLWKATQGVIFSLPDTLLHCEGKWCYIINQTNQETSAVFTQADIKNKL